MLSKSVPRWRKALVALNFRRFSGEPSVGRVEYNEVRRNRPTEFDAVPCVLAHKCYRDAAETGCFASSVIAGRVGRWSVFSANSPRSGDILYSNCVINCRTQRARVAKKWLSI